MAHQVARFLSYDFLLTQMIFGIVYHLCIILFPKLAKREKIILIVVFHIGGFLNWFGEFLAMNAWLARWFEYTGGVAFTGGGDPFTYFITFCIGWLDHGLIFTTGYILIKYWVRPDRLPKKFVLLMGLVYIGGIILTSIRFGFLSETVRTWRIMQDEIHIMLIVVALVLIVFFFVIRYRQLLWRLIVVSCLLGVSFELRMLAAGIRYYEGADRFVGALIGTASEVNSGILFSFFLILIIGKFIVKGIFFPERYSDENWKKPYDSFEAETDS